MQVEFSRKAVKDYNKAPLAIQHKVRYWTIEVETHGIKIARLKPGWRDHQLIGKRKGQRSVYLNKAWRLIYAEESYEIIIIEIHKHNY